MKEFPKYQLKKEIKNRILSSYRLQGLICDFFSIHPNTLRRWIAEDSPQLLNFNLLSILWLEGEEEKITDLLTILKNYNDEKNINSNEPSVN